MRRMILIIRLINKINASMKIVAFFPWPKGSALESVPMTQSYNYKLGEQSYILNRSDKIFGRSCGDG